VKKKGKQSTALNESENTKKFVGLTESITNWKFMAPDVQQRTGKASPQSPKRCIPESNTVKSQGVGRGPWSSFQGTWVTLGVRIK
jgi:hypothetical protein